MRSWDAKLLPVEEVPGDECSQQCYCLSFPTMNSWWETTISSCSAVLVSGSAKSVIFKIFILGIKKTPKFWFWGFFLDTKYLKHRVELASVVI